MVCPRATPPTSLSRDCLPALLLFGEATRARGHHFPSRHHARWRRVPTARDHPRNSGQLLRRGDGISTRLGYQHTRRHRRCATSRGGRGSTRGNAARAGRHRASGEPTTTTTSSRVEPATVAPSPQPSPLVIDPLPEVPEPPVLSDEPPAPRVERGPRVFYPPGA